MRGGLIRLKGTLYLYECVARVIANVKAKLLFDFFSVAKNEQAHGRARPQRAGQPAKGKVAGHTLPTIASPV